jgi:hypothetical protein
MEFDRGLTVIQELEHDLSAEVSDATRMFYDRLSSLFSNWLELGDAYYRKTKDGQLEFNKAGFERQPNFAFFKHT